MKVESTNTTDIQDGDRVTLGTFPNPEGGTPLGGIDVVFQLTPGTEAPAEMNFYLPQPECNALCMAENATPTLHNLYSLRGAQVRDAKNWANYLNAAVDRYCTDTTDATGATVPGATVLFASHFWPRWKEGGGDQIVDFLTKQADMYRFLHDQALRLANHGRTMHEIAEDLDQMLPASLKGEWYNHGYYGTTNHDIKAVYQRYLGWYDGNVAHLHGLPPDKVGARYVEAMGGASEVLTKAQAAFDNATSADDYRWAAELLSHLVFADPNDPLRPQAKLLEADVLEQLGYQAESGPWRNFYLAGAQELRGAEPDSGQVKVITDDVIATMPLDMVFDYFGIRLNGPTAATSPLLTIGLAVQTPDGMAMKVENCTVLLRNGVLVFQLRETPPLDTDPKHYSTYTITRAGLNELALAEHPVLTLDTLQAKGALTITSGSHEPLSTLMSYMESFKFAFALTVPEPETAGVS